VSADVKQPIPAIQEIVRGLADMVSIVPRRDPRPYPGVHRSAAEALRSDWVKLGGDMRAAARKVLGGEG
jgi:hypothetical protein